MKFFLKTSLQIAAAILLLALPLAAAEPEKFFPVMPWSSVPDDTDVINKIKECGFTVAGFVAPKTLETCRKAGLKAIVSDPLINNYDWAHFDELKAHEKPFPPSTRFGRTLPSTDIICATSRARIFSPGLR